MQVLNTPEMSLRIGCSIIPCIQSVSSACSYRINQQWFQANMQSNRIHVWMQSQYFKFMDLTSLAKTKVVSEPALTNL